MSNKPSNETMDMSSTTYKLLITRVYRNWRRETPEVDIASVEAGIEFVKSLGLTSGNAAVTVHEIVAGQRSRAIGIDMDGFTVADQIITTVASGKATLDRITKIGDTPLGVRS